MRKNGLLLILTLICLGRFQLLARASDKVQVGDVVRSLEALGSILDGSSGAPAPRPELRDKVLVIEFWDTRCGPCVASIPIWNKLNQRYMDKPVVFLAVSREDAPTIAAFVKKKPMGGLVAVDADGSIFKSFGIKGIPRTAILHRDGRLAGWSHVSSLYENPDVLDRILRGEPVELSATPYGEGVDLFADVESDIGTTGGAQAPPLCMILIRPARPDKFPFGGTSRERRIENVTVREAILQVYDVPWANVIVEMTPPEEKYDILFRWPRGEMNAGRRLLRDAFETTFNLTMKRESRTADVFILDVIENRESSWEPASMRVAIDLETGNTGINQEMLDRVNKGDKFFFTLGSTPELAGALSYALDAPVIDEAKVEGYYAFYFPWSKETSTREEVIKTMREKYGVTLTPAKREVEMLVVRSADAP